MPQPDRVSDVADAPRVADPGDRLRRDPVIAVAVARPWRHHQQVATATLVTVEGLCDRLDQVVAVLAQGTVGDPEEVRARAFGEAGDGALDFRPAQGGDLLPSVGR